MSKEIFVVGNGASLKDFDFNFLKDKEWIGCCLAYRYWEKTDIYPTHYVNVDSVVLKNNLEDIKNLKVQNLTEENCVLFLWTIQKYLKNAFDVMQEWGFKYQRTITWDKKNGMCLFGFHHRTEFLLFGYKGKLPMYPKRKTFPTLVEAKSKYHSNKPHIFREYIQKFGDKKIELFARQKVEGWDCWGNEV